jgi:uncharacterized membrane protein (DUF2068 family)
MEANRQPGFTPHHRPKAEIQVLRGIAMLEVGKGVLILLVAGVFLFVVHREASDIGEAILDLLHISPDHHFAHVFLSWTDRIADQKTWVVLSVAGGYCILRFVEAYGLWHARAWAEWFALFSASLYIPFEANGLVREPNLFHTSLLIVNLGIIFYMAYLRMSERTGRRALGKSDAMS